MGAVWVADCYTIDTKLNKQQIEKAQALLANPIIEKASVTLDAPRKFDYAIEIGYLPGVTDNVGSTAKETLEDGARVKFTSGQHVYTSQVFFISGGVTRIEIEKIKNSLYNPLIQRASLKSFANFKQDSGMDLVAPKVKLTASTKVSRVDLNVKDDELAKLGKLGIADSDGTRRGPLSLSLDYLLVIRNYFNKLGRKPTDVEIETLAQTWSEHCKHTIFADPIDNLQQGLYKTFIKGATQAIRKQKGRKDFCVSVFTDNAGGIVFDKDNIITHKVETHNTPSALDPFGGAITGIVGVNRDCLGFGLGAKPIINTFGFCFADPQDKTVLYRDKELTRPMLSARKIFEGVISGINAGGNQSGIPTNSGFLYFDSRYQGKPLVFAGTVGLIPRSIKGKPSWVKQTKAGDLIVVAGGRVGADGIHGATFSSETLDSHSPATAVQIGDPITQKKLSDAIVKEARDKGLYSSITDCGAGGLSSAVGEMATQSGGCVVELDKVPLKYPGLAPWQIWISESQERMIFAVPPKKWKEFFALMKKRGVESTTIGKFTKDGKCVVKFKNQTVLDLEMEFLHNGRPIKQQNTKHVTRNTKHVTVPQRKILNLESRILNLLSRLNITSTDFVNTQYDHEVQAGSVLKPLQGRGRINADATVTRPILTSKKGVILSYGMYPSYSELDPYKMAAASIDTAIRNAVVAGADVDYLALLDNFCWCSPEDPQRLWQLKEAARACFDYATTFGTPFISGKDSMYNDFKGFDKDGKSIKISIPPTLLISAIGVVPDVNKTVSLDAKMPGDVIYILGKTNNELSGSEYNNMQLETNDSQLEVTVPSVDAAENYRLYKSVFNAIQKDLIASSISITRGGLITALIKTLAGGGLGGEINFTDLPGKWEENYQALFSESQGRILVTVDPKNAEAFESAMSGNIFAKIGTVSKNDKLIIADRNNKKIVDLKIPDALKAYKEKFKDY